MSFTTVFYVYMAETTYKPPALICPLVANANLFQHNLRLHDGK